MKRTIPDHLKARLIELPSRSGVYLFKDRHNRALYIGKALSLKKRVAGHFRYYGDMASKEGIFLNQVSRIDVIETPSEAEALLLEASLVKEQLPKYNKLLRDDKSFPFLKVTDEEYPRLLIARGRKSDGSRYFGPYTDAHLLKKAVKMLRREYPLRTCRKLPKRVCLLYHLDLCGGPCEGHQSKEAYGVIVRELVRFLEGRREALVRNLSKRMKGHAAAHQFEKAQAMRDAILALSSVQIPSKAALAPADVLAEFQRQFSLPRLPLRIECFDISNIHGNEAVGSMVVFEGGEPLRKQYRRFRIKSVAGIDDYKMMREVVRRRYIGTLAHKLPKPDLVLIDGGKGHLSAAKRELDEIGFADMPVLAIAKQHEILFSPEREGPYVLPATSPVLQMIRRLRDEAHRFAIRYHRLLHRRAMLAKKGGAMKRTRTLVLAVLTAAAVCLPVRQAAADMVEVQGEGILNGQVLSDDGENVEFKDAFGNIRVIPKSSVAYLDMDKSDVGSAKSAVGKKLKQKVIDAFEAIKGFPQTLKNYADRKTKEWKRSMSKPLDRSSADQKGAQLAKSMEEASRATAASQKKTLTANKEFKRQQNEASDAAGGQSVKSGRFRSLD